ncbi:hypothetical protein BpHYR1_001565 [Brachionus plicatilis]|uniref:Uncharacterized protein n=1 Tax=Brachionus plicatilis TaxID=10195 RepID=A0A3M7Q977_BRAPC|nr:hypothetical protein BpHYR1_001565 [Brachionus plicatilis]
MDKKDMSGINRDLIGQLKIVPELSSVTSSIQRSLILNQDFTQSSVYQGYKTVEVQPVPGDAFLAKALQKKFLNFCNILIFDEYLFKRASLDSYLIY